MNRLVEAFRMERGRPPEDVGELIEWTKTPEGAAAVEDCKEQEKAEVEAEADRRKWFQDKGCPSDLACHDCAISDTCDGEGDDAA